MVSAAWTLTSKLAQITGRVLPKMKWSYEKGQSQNNLIYVGSFDNFSPDLQQNLREDLSHMPSGINVVDESIIRYQFRGESLGKQGLIAMSQSPFEQNKSIIAVTAQSDPTPTRSYRKPCHIRTMGFS